MSASSTAAGPAGSPPTSRAAPVNVEVLVYHTVIVLLALAALLVVLRIPRAFARLWRTSEWTRGHFLGYEPFTGPSFHGSFGHEPSNFGYSKELGSDDSHVTYDRSSKEVLISATGRPSSRAYPPHMEPTPPVLRPLVSLLRCRISPGISMSQLVVYVGYLGVLLYAAIYRTTGPFSDFTRYGYIAVSQIPFVFGLGSKNNVLGMFLGMGYEKLHFLHRFVARLAIIAAHIHGVGYVYKWCLAKNFKEQIVNSQNYFGLCALICLDGLLLFSMSYVRKNAYNLFLYSHIFFLHALLVVGYMHHPQLRPYIYCAVGIYGLDRVLRMCKTRLSTATIRAIPELGTTRIEFPDVNKGWRAGQHVRIQVLSSAMGVTGWAEPHPFTIASRTNSPEGLVLMCKKTGTWTQKLYAAAVASRTEAGPGRRVKIMVEGPYGGPGFAMFNSYSAALFIVGGSGISFALGAIQELIQQDAKGESRVRVIELVWVVQDASSLGPLIPRFASIIQQNASARLSISVYYTKAIVHKLRTNSVHSGLSLTPGRPRLIGTVETVISVACGATNARGDVGKCGLLVAVCGPVGLGDDVSKAVGLVDPVKRDAIGGIEMHEEVFGW